VKCFKAVHAEHQRRAASTVIFIDPVIVGKMSACITASTRRLWHRHMPIELLRSAAATSELARECTPQLRDARTHPQAATTSGRSL